MKKLYLSFVLFYAFVSINLGQIVYTSSDFGQPGDVYSIASKYIDDASTMLSDYESNWDFSDVETDSIDTVRFVLPSETAFADSFPDASVCIIDTDGSLAFVNVTDNFAQLLGAASDFSGFGQLFEYRLPDEFFIARFPATLQTSFENSTEFTITESPENLGLNMDSLGFPVNVDSLRIKVRLSDESIIDTSGIITLPQGSFDCLRESRTESLSMDLEVLVFTLWIPVEDYSLNTTSHIKRFHAKEFGYPILELAADSNDRIFGISHIYEEAILSPQLVSGYQPFVFPNPAEKYLNISTSNMGRVNMDIYNIAGEKVISYKNISQSGPVNIEDLANGLYILKVRSVTGNGIQLAKFSVLK